MDLNSIKLSEFVVREWYKDALVIAASALDLPDSPAPTPRTVPPPSRTESPSPPPSRTDSPSPPPSRSVSPSPAPPASQPFKYLGNNGRHITLLVREPGIAFLPDTHLAFLTKILEACRLTLADVAIVNNAAAPVTIPELRQQLQPKTILLFGVDPAAIRLPINFPPFRPQGYDDCTYLAVPSLDQLVPNTDDSKLLKSKLWVCLKTIFNV